MTKPLPSSINSLRDDSSRLHIDFECFSEVDIKKAGMWPYAMHPSTEMLCMCWSFGDEPVALLLPGEPLPQRIIAHVKDGGEVAGHNVGFEYVIWNFVCNKAYGWPKLKKKQLVDTAAKAASLALPRDLAGCAKALGVAEKDEAGKRVMLKLAKPRKPSAKNPATRWTKEAVPGDYEILYEYCKQDVVVERAIDQRLPDLPPMEQTVWEMDLQINQNGLLIDIPLVDTVRGLNDQYKEGLEERCIEIAGCKSSQRQNILNWSLDNGYKLDGYTKDDVAKGIRDPYCPDIVKEVLNIRAECGKTSITKYNAFKVATCPDSRLRGMFLYHGAQTGRWAGRVVQLHNLYRGSVKDVDLLAEMLFRQDLELLSMFYGTPTEAFASCIRSVIMAPDGRILVVVDYSGIEGRQVQWLAEDEEALSVFRSGRCAYRDMATVIFDVAYEEVTDDMRFVGKIAILGLGYNMGVDTFLATCDDWGHPISRELAEITVYAYRRKHKKLKALWGKIEAAAIECIVTGKPTRVNDYLWFYKEDRWLFMVLPSGRKISYFDPEVKSMKTKWGKVKDGIRYWGVDTYTRKFQRTATYGGKLVENAVQAISRDIMACGMFRLNADNHKIVGHVHDEIIIEAPIGALTVEEMIHKMCIIPSWGKNKTNPNLDMVIQAEGSLLKRYKK